MMGLRPLPNAIYQVSWKSAHWFWRRRFLKVLAIYSHGGHLGHVTWTIYIKFRSPFLRMLHMKFGFDWPSGFKGEDLQNCGRRTTTDAGTWVYYKLTCEPCSKPYSILCLFRCWATLEATMCSIILHKIQVNEIGL